MDRYILTSYLSTERPIGCDCVFRFVAENSPQDKIEFLIRQYLQSLRHSHSCRDIQLLRLLLTAMDVLGRHGSKFSVSSGKFFVIKTVSILFFDIVVLTKLDF